MNQIFTQPWAALVAIARPVVSPRLSVAKQHAVHMACAARYRCQAEGLLGKVRDNGYGGWSGPWGGNPETLKASAKLAITFAKQEIEAARILRIGTGA